MKHIVLTLLFLLLLPSWVSANELNAGIVEGLWYGGDTVLAGKPTRIYVALRNNTAHDLSGTVRFTDNDTQVGIAYVNALPGRIVEAWTTWTPTYGEHTIVALLSDVRVSPSGEEPTVGEVESTIAKDSLFVDYDTDEDGTPNEADTDDDNDGVSDTDESTTGTNPLVKETPNKENTEQLPVEHGTNDRSDERRENDDGEVRGAETSSRAGLERYLEGNTGETAVASVTEVIAEAKESLDAYRTTRNDAMKEYFKDERVLIEEPTTTEDGTATITRRYIEKEESFFESVLRGGKALIASLYTFLLYLTSKALAYPAFIELLLLLLIIYLVYRTARRLGRRRYP